MSGGRSALACSAWAAATSSSSASRAQGTARAACRAAAFSLPAHVLRELRGALLERAHRPVELVRRLGRREDAIVVGGGDDRRAELAHLRVDLWRELQLVREDLRRHPGVVVGPDELAHTGRVDVELALAVGDAHRLDELREKQRESSTRGQVRGGYVQDNTSHGLARAALRTWLDPSSWSSWNVSENSMS